MSEKAREIEVSSEYLKKFSEPLWDKLDLESCKPLSAIEGEQDGFQFIMIDMQHLRYGLFAENGATAITTFFIIVIPDGKAGRDISFCPDGCDVAADNEYVYLAKAGKQARPKEWRQLIQLTIDVANSLRGSSKTAGILHATKRTYRPVGAGVVVNAFWGIVMLIFAVLLLGTGVGMMLGLIDYRPGCPTGVAASSCKTMITVYRLGEALKTGGQYVLGGLFCVFGALYFRERVRKRL